MPVPIANSKEDMRKRAVILMDDCPARASLLKRAIEEAGYPLLAKLDQLSALLPQIITHQPQAIILGVDAPNRALLEQLAAIQQQQPRPVILFAEREAPELIQQIVRVGVSAYVIDDIQPQRLRSIISIACARFEENQSLRSELSQAKLKLSERKQVEQAKGLLMQHHQLSEPEAYQSLRKMAMDKGKTLTCVAESVIDVFNMGASS